MARARARRHAAGLRVVLGQGTLGRVEAVDEDVIGAEVWHIDEAVGGIGIDAMRMRAGLAGLVRTRTFVLEGTAGGAERTVGLEREAGDRTRTIVRGEEILAGLVDGNVRGALALGVLAVEEGGLAVGGKAIRGDPAAGDFGRGVQELAVVAQGQVGRALRLGDDDGRRELAGLRIDGPAEDALGVGAGSADVIGQVGGEGGGGHEGEEREEGAHGDEDKRTQADDGSKQNLNAHPTSHPTRR